MNDIPGGTGSILQILEAGPPPLAGAAKSLAAAAWSKCGNFLAVSLGGFQVYLYQWKPAPAGFGHEYSWQVSRVLQVGTTPDAVATALEFGEGDSSRRRRQDRRRPSASHHDVLCVGKKSGDIKVYDVHTGRIIWYLRDHRQAVKGMSCAIDGSLRLATASLDGTCKLWDLWDDGNMYRTLKQENCKAWHKAVWSPDVTQLCTVGSQKCVLLWNKLQFKKLVGHHNTVTDAEYSPDGVLVATSSMDTRVILWDTETASPISEFWHGESKLHFIYLGGSNDHHVRRLQFSRHGEQLITLCDDGKSRIWSLGQDITRELGSSHSEHPQEVQMPRVTSSSLKPGLTLAANYTCSQFVAGPYDGKFLLIQGDKDVPTLKHLSRMAIRRTTLSSNIEQLPLPKIYRKFLIYK